MFLGHFGIALAAKRVAPRAPLAALVVAAQFLDLLWPMLVFAGIERLRIAPGITVVNPLDFTYYPWSHGLLLTLAWGALAGGAYWLWRRQAREAWVIAALVPSHWLLDLIVHRPDLPLAPGLAPLYGWGGWNSVALSATLEVGLLLGGLALYLARFGAGLGRAGQAWLAGWMLLMLAIYAGSLWGPPPPNPQAVAASALGMWLFVALAWASERRLSPPVPA